MRHAVDSQAVIKFVDKIKPIRIGRTTRDDSIVHQIFVNLVSGTVRLGRFGLETVGDSGVRFWEAPEGEVEKAKPWLSSSLEYFKAHARVVETVSVIGDNGVTLDYVKPAKRLLKSWYANKLQSA